MKLLSLGRALKWLGSSSRQRPCELHATESLMAATQRELAIHSANMMGVQCFLGEFGPGNGAQGPARASRRLFRDLIENSAHPVLILDPRPGLHIIDCNDAYAAVSMVERRRVAGEKLFEVFPDNPGLPNAAGVSILFESLKTCAQSGRAHRMAVMRYDIQDRSGQFVKRHWRPVNRPIFDDNGRLVFLVHEVGCAVEA